MYLLFYTYIESFCTMMVDFKTVVKWLRHRLSELVKRTTSGFEYAKLWIYCLLQCNLKLLGVERKLHKRICSHKSEININANDFWHRYFNQFTTSVSFVSDISKQKLNTCSRFCIQYHDSHFLLKCLYETRKISGHVFVFGSSIDFLFDSGNVRTILFFHFISSFPLWTFHLYI